jgi:5'(3')-deoxyribonucleotidase
MRAYQFISEKAVSKKQQQFFGIVRAMQKGDMPKGGEAGEVAKDMKKSDVKDFAKTKHKGLPTKKKKESIAYEDMFQGLNPKSEIYVDMDGVLADFFGEWKKLVGKDWREIGKDEIEPALKKIRDEEDFWLNIPLTSNAKKLLGIIKQVKGDYKILSSPLANDPNSEPHKREWIEKNLDFFPPTEVIITKDKAKYATNPDGTPNILIDDYGVNIAAWESAGGIGFKHKDHKFERTAKKLKAEIEESFQHLLREHIEEISAKDIGAGALAGLMALTPVSKAFGQDANTNPLPNKQTSTMVQKDVAGKKDLSKIQAPAEKDFWKVTINYKGKDVDLKLPFSAGTNKKQIKQFIDDMMSQQGVKDYAVKDIDTLNKVPIDQSILKKLVQELEKRNGKQSIPYLAGMAKRAGAKPGADNAHAIAAMKAYLGK